MKTWLCIVLGWLFLPGMALAQDADGVDLLLEVLRVPQGEVTAFAASSLIASLWSVSDLSTRDLFVRFYRYLVEGSSRLEALWKAQMDVAMVRHHPFHWAPFILIGKER